MALAWTFNFWLLTLPYFVIQNRSGQSIAVALGYTVAAVIADIIVSLGLSHVRNVRNDARLLKQAVGEMFGFPRYVYRITSPQVRFSALMLLGIWVAAVLKSWPQGIRNNPGSPLMSLVAGQLFLIVVPIVVILCTLWCVALCKCIGVFRFFGEIGAAIVKGVAGFLIGLGVSYGLALLVIGVIYLSKGLSPFELPGAPRFFLFVWLLAPSLIMPALSWLIERLDGPSLAARYPEYKKLTRAATTG